MDDELPDGLPSVYTQFQKLMRARLQPASAVEERLVEQIVLCQYTLERLERQLAKTWEQLDRISEEL
jgi:hypothetical protein